jgi:predicted molibdopterin-dependent oxidoreductase YjgC
MVEIVRRGWPQLVTACSYPIRDDMVINTESERAVRARTGIMQLLLARAPGNPALADLAKQIGVEGTPFPKVSEAQRDCILCGLCVNVCDQVIGASAISFADRGPTRAVAAPFRAPSEDCIGCGACARVCPVGTIKLRYTEDTVEVSPFKSVVKLRRCVECGAPLTGGIAADRIDAKLDLAEFLHITSTCDACKRKATARKVAEIPTAGSLSLTAIVREGNGAAHSCSVLP